MEQFIRNPETGRQIMVDGPTYRRLLTRGIPLDNRRSFPLLREKNVRPVKTSTGRVNDVALREAMVMDLYQSTPVEDLQRLATAPWQKRHYRTLLANKDKRRGSATRGWSLKAPKKGRDRHELMKRCGQKCFLREGEAFPICPSCRSYAGDCQCRIDCDGVNAAYVRARQWKYPDVASAAERILREKCGRR